MRRRVQRAIVALSVSAALLPISAVAQSRPRPAPRQPSHEITIGGFVLVGRMNFGAKESFSAISDRPSAPLFGGGATVGLPWAGGGLFVDVGAWRVKKDGERVFVSDGTVFKLGIPLSVIVTPIEITGGWRFRHLWRRFTPYVGAGFSSYGYEETSQFARTDEDVSERFSGYHLLGGGEYRVTPLVGVGAEVGWSSVANALGTAGVAAEFRENNLGGTTVRARLTIGR